MVEKRKWYAKIEESGLEDGEVAEKILSKAPSNITLEEVKILKKENMLNWV